MIFKRDVKRDVKTGCDKKNGMSKRDLQWRSQRATEKNGGYTVFTGSWPTFFGAVGQ